MLRKTSVLVVILLVLVSLAAPALAHVDLISSDPESASVVAVPTDRIELAFSGEVKPSGDGIQIFDADGNTLHASVFQPTQSRVVAELEAPLLNGAYAVTWQIQTPDSHIVSGSFSFAVEIPEAAPTDSEAAPPVSAVPPPVATTVTVAPRVPPARVSVAPAPVRRPIQIVVDEPNTALEDWLARIGRWAAMTGALLAIGAFAFAATSLIGTRSEVETAVRWVRWGSMLVLAGTLIEVVGMSVALAGSPVDALSPSSLIGVLGSQFGVAVLLRFAGGVAMLQDPRFVAISPGRPIADASRLPAVLGPGQPSASRVATATMPSATTYRLEVQHEWVAMAGMAAVVASFMFDGHTVTTDAVLLTRASSVVHIVFAGVWLGGVVVMANTLTRRWRASVPLDAAAMAVRFSRIAAASVALTAAAGIALTWTIIDTPSDLISSAWGRLILVKITLVGVAAALGAYNHFRVVPRLDKEASESEASDLLRRVVRIEGIVLLVVVAVTAILVSAAT
jgi:copper transport protein